MKKKWATIVIVLLSIIIVIGCNKRESTKEEIYAKYQQKLVRIKSYTCLANVSVIGNKSTKEYSFKHEYNKPDDYSVLILAPKQLKGKSIKYTKEKIIVENNYINDKFELPNSGKENLYLFIGDFIKNSMQTDDIKIKMNKSSLILEICIPGESDYFSKQVLYIDKNTIIPTKLEIQDSVGDKKFIVNYEKFQYKQ